MKLLVLFFIVEILARASVCQEKHSNKKEIKVVDVKAMDDFYDNYEEVAEEGLNHFEIGILFLFLFFLPVNEYCHRHVL